MKLIILVALFAFACAEIIETYESGPLVVPENKEEFLARTRNLPPKGRNGRISNGNGDSVLRFLVVCTYNQWLDS